MKLALFAFAAFALMATSHACACTVLAPPGPPQLPYVATGLYPLLAIAGVGGTAVPAESVALDLTVLSAPIHRPLCGAQTVAGGGAERAVTASEVAHAVDLLAAAGIKPGDVTTRMTHGAPNPWNHKSLALDVGVIEITLHAPVEVQLRDVLNRIGPVIERAPQLRIASLSLRRRSCDHVTRAYNAGAEDARVDAAGIATRLGFDTITMLNYRATSKPLDGGPSSACGAQQSTLPFFQEYAPDIEAIARGESNPITIPDVRTQFFGGGIFALRGSPSEAEQRLTKSVTTSFLPTDEPSFSRSIVLPQPLTFVTGMATFSALVPYEVGAAPEHDPELRGAVVARAFHRARERAMTIAQASHHGLGRLLVINVENGPGYSYAFCCDARSIAPGAPVRISRTVVAAWELIGASSHAHGKRGLPDMPDYWNGYEAEIAIVPELGGLSMIGSAARPLLVKSTPSECQTEALQALTDAAKNAAFKANGSMRALLDEGDAFYDADFCAADIRPFWLRSNYFGMSGPSVGERVLVVP